MLPTSYMYNTKTTREITRIQLHYPGKKCPSLQQPSYWGSTACYEIWPRYFFHQT